MGSITEIDDYNIIMSSIEELNEGERQRYLVAEEYYGEPPQIIQLKHELAGVLTLNR